VIPLLSVCDCPAWKKGTLKTYPGLPHGMCTMHPDVINEDLLAFVKA
jgi:non-heme chloroperoxidase